jgi:hypothetical protein
MRPPCGAPVSLSVTCRVPVSTYPALSQPLADQAPGGERPDGFEQFAVRDRVECSLDVRVQHPLLALVGARDVEDPGYGVVAGASGSETVAGRPEASFPVGLQGVLDDRLYRPITDRGDAQRSQFAVCFRYVRPPRRSGLPRLVGAYLVHQLASGLRRLDHEHVHARGALAHVGLRHPAHAQERVGLASQHELLQRPNLAVLALLGCPEDAPSQVANGPVDLTPVYGVPVGSPSLGSVC